jgi:hypothetical protein
MVKRGKKKDEGMGWNGMEWNGREKGKLKKENVCKHYKIWNDD